jgi:predicted RNase H-like HicB family nuclease
MPARYNSRMKNLTVEIIPDPDEGAFTARVPDIPAYGEGQSEEEAIADLREALTAYIETFGIDDALARVNAPSSLRRLDIELEDLARA